ncbi:MAG: hypothetical protein IJR98_06060, partial [Synergistaceae bacterium]|nr:hypothetical protein [Synergistaceae bacterium]
MLLAPLSDAPQPIPEEIDCQPESQNFVDNETEQAPEPEPLNCQLEIPENVDNEDDDLKEIPDDHEWQERATGFTLSLDDPPPELWTGINDDDEELDYEETDSLQGAAYVQI